MDKTCDTLCWQGREAATTSTHWGWERNLVPSFRKTIPQYLWKVNMDASYEPEIQFLVIRPTETRTYLHGETCIRIQRGTLVVAKKLKLTYSSTVVFSQWITSEHWERTSYNDTLPCVWISKIQSWMKETRHKKMAECMISFVKVLKTGKMNLWSQKLG